MIINRHISPIMEAKNRQKTACNTGETANAHRFAETEAERCKHLDAKSRKQGCKNAILQTFHRPSTGAAPVTDRKNFAPFYRTFIEPTSNLLRTSKGRANMQTIFDYKQ